MATYGYTLMSEEHDPRELVDIARTAEGLGFDFLVASDHYHPWVPEQQHSPYAWTVLGAVAAVTERVELATLVTCPILRYHPVVVAQKAATMAVLSEGRFTLGVGAGERLNEHVVGRGHPLLSGFLLQDGDLALLGEEGALAMKCASDEAAHLVGLACRIPIHRSSAWDPLGIVVALESRLTVGIETVVLPHREPLLENANIADGTIGVFGLDAAIARLSLVIVHLLDDSCLRIDGTLLQKSLFGPALVDARHHSACVVGLTGGFTVGERPVEGYGRGVVYRNRQNARRGASGVCLEKNGLNISFQNLVR